MPSWSIPKRLPEKVSALERARRALEQIFASRPRAERERPPS